MKPEVYLECLQLVAARDSLPPSDLHPVLATDIYTLEREIGASLPDQYEDFLREAGCGEEHGGLSRWHHLDITRPGNLIEINHEFAHQQIKRMRSEGISVSRFPRALFVVYDPCDGEVYGFMQDSSRFNPQVVAWDTDEFTLRTVAQSFAEFLEYVSDCDEEELEEARKAMMRRRGIQEEPKEEVAVAKSSEEWFD
jgi:hypothetical protein